MKILIDTNIIIDVLTERKPHFEHSSQFLNLCGAQIIGMILASQTTDIFYILRREGKTEKEARAVIKKLIDNLKVLDVFAADVNPALDSDMPDYEDSLLAYSAYRYKADYIITRNEKDFKDSPVSALSPAEFIKKISTAK
ncbi:MAG: PIN domain-containing protein [Oscillospiraceae bacterium]|nr:PIN domain-containing protein [Oscillospiraceae bacterium]